MEENKPPLMIFNFNEAYEVPIYNYVKKNEYRFLSWGSDNVYPQLLLDLYENYGSPLHKAIINKKEKLISGFGFKEVLDPSLRDYIDYNDLNLLARQITRDFELFNCFAIEVIWDKSKTKMKLHYIPVHTLRFGLNEDGTEVDNYFWFSKDWSKFKKKGFEPEYVKRYDPSIRDERSIFYYTHPSAYGMDFYGSPGYSNGINYVSLDYEIGQYHLNFTKQGFQSSAMIYFGTGIPPAEEQRQFYNEFMRSYSGTKNSGRVMLSWGEGDDQKPQFTTVKNEGSDERFIMLKETVEENIILAHEIPLALLVSTPGKLASTDERKELLQEFQLYYISDRQTQIEANLNKLLKDQGFTEKLEFKTYLDTQEQSQIVKQEITTNI